MLRTRAVEIGVWLVAVFRWFAAEWQNLHTDPRNARELLRNVSLLLIVSGTMLIVLSVLGMIFTVTLDRWWSLS